MAVDKTINERGADGSVETNFRRDVRHALDMHPLDRDDVMVEAIKRLKRVEAACRNEWRPMSEANLDSANDVLIQDDRGNLYAAHYQRGARSVEDHSFVDEGWYCRNGRVPKPLRWKNL